MQTADRTIVAQLQRIDPGLNVAWVDPPGRWAVTHDLQTPGNFDATVDHMALVLQREASARGYSLDKTECAFLSMQALKDSKVVCYVTEDDGRYRPLDGRVVQKLQRMDWYRQNLGVKDWTQMLNVKAEAARNSRQRERNDIWDTLKTDKVFARQVSDILWGLKPMRSLFVEGVEFHADHERNGEGSSGAGAGTVSDDHGRDRDPVAPPVPGDPEPIPDDAA